MPTITYDSDLGFQYGALAEFFNKERMDVALQSPPYRSRMFYRYERNQFRWKTDMQGKISGDHFKWSAGLAFQHFENNYVNTEKLNKGKRTIFCHLLTRSRVFMNDTRCLA